MLTKGVLPLQYIHFCGILKLVRISYETARISFSALPVYKFLHQINRDSTFTFVFNKKVRMKVNFSAVND